MQFMNRIPVISSNLASVGYDPQTLTLEVEFSDGSIYQYFDVPETIFESLMQANSKGSFLATQIKHYFRYTRI